MIFYYFDASAWVKQYYQETGTTWVRDLFAKNLPIVCSTLGYVEVMATLARKRKGGEINPNSFEEKIQELEADWENFFQLEMSSEVVLSARDIARDLALRGADSFHLASALFFQRLSGQEKNKFVFVASDHELKEAAQSSGLQVIDPTEQESQTSKEPEEEGENQEE